MEVLRKNTRHYLVRAAWKKLHGGDHGLTVRVIEILNEDGSLPIATCNEGIRQKTARRIPNDSRLGKVRFLPVGLHERHRPSQMQSEDLALHHQRQKEEGHPHEIPNGYGELR